MANCDDNTCPPNQCDLNNAINDYKKSRSGVNDSSVKPFLKIIDHLQKEIECIDNTGSSGTSGYSGTNGSSGSSGSTGTSGSSGSSGTSGETGSAGVGVPVGGSSGQVLAKLTDADYETHWIDIIQPPPFESTSGTSGSSGSTGERGGDGSSGSSGSSGISGIGGSSGSSGINGIDGANSGRWSYTFCEDATEYPYPLTFKTFDSDGTINRNISDVVKIRISKYANEVIDFNNWFVSLKTFVNSSATVYLQLHQLTDNSIMGLWSIDSIDDSYADTYGFYELDVSIIVANNVIDCNALCSISWISSGFAGEGLKPTVNLTSPTIIQFNQININNKLTGSFIINQSGATISGSKLEWRRNNSGSWNLLTSSLNSPLYFTHSLIDTNFNTSSFNYRYFVIDSIGSNASASLNITPVTYATASANLNVIGTSISLPETNRKRERGNVSTTLSGLITKNSNFVSMSSYTVQFRVNEGNWFGVPGLTNVAMNGNTVTIPSTVHIPTGSANITDVDYQVEVVDTYSTSSMSYKSINFFYLFFYGPSASRPITSSTVRSLDNRLFMDYTGSFILYTGGAYSIFTVAMPSTFNLTEVLDLDAGYTNLTTNYSQSNFNVMDSGSNATPYHIYTLSNSIAYTDYNHRHRISTTGLLWYTPTVTTLDYTE